MSRVRISPGLNFFWRSEARGGRGTWGKKGLVYAADLQY